MMTEIIYLLLGLAVGLILFFVQKTNSVSKTEYQKMQQDQINAVSNQKMFEDRNQNLLLELQQLKTKLEANLNEINSLNSTKASLETNLLHLKSYIQKTEIDIKDQKQTNDEQQREILALQKSIVDMQANNRYLGEKLSNQKSEVDEIRKQSHIEFQNLANKILEESTKKFTTSNKENIDQILKPLGENLDTFKKKVEETYDKESKQRFSLEEKVKELIELNYKLSQEANNLTSALKGQSKKQGNWGEMILESILDKSGLQKNREYFVQSTLTDDEGKMLRPDVIINLPDERTIVIDSKVSLNAYEKYCAEEDKDQQDTFLQMHIAAIYQHIDDLSKKKYEKLTKGLDFTMMFMPIEPAYMLAMQEDHELWSYAYNKRILLISPTNLIAALKLIADLWKREQQSRNAQEIANQGEKLYEKFVGFVDSIEDIGRNINRSQDAYLKAKNQLSEGKGNLIGQALKLKGLGIKSDKSINPGMLPLEIQEDDNS